MLLFIVDVICSVILVVYLCSRAVAFVRRFEEPRLCKSDRDYLEKVRAEHERTNAEQGSADNEAD